MTDTEWERLTPGKKVDINRAFYRLCQEESYPHEIAFARAYHDTEQISYRDRFAYTDPELDALATKSEKVQALVKYARMAEWGTGVISRCPECKNYKSEGHTSDCGFVAALAPFKED